MAVQKEIIDAFGRMKAKDYDGALVLLQDGLREAEAAGDAARQALFQSTLGVLAKVRGDFKEAWRRYERSEKLLPDDPSLKVISAKLLIDQFSEYDAAVGKLKKVLKIAKGSGVYEHHAHATMAIAYLRKGDRKKAVECFDLAMNEDFNRLPSVGHLNFEVLEAFLSRSFEVERCRRYVTEALRLAREQGEGKAALFLTKLLESFETTQTAAL